MKNISGIYCLRCKVNNKRYIGKSINIKSRFYSHKYVCTQKTRSKKHVNEYLYKAVQKYGWENFEKEIIECFIDFNEEYAKERELFWILYFNTIHSKNGYNLRMDSSTKMIVHNKTRLKMSNSVKGVNNPNYNNKWTDKMKKDLSEKKKEMYRNGLINITDDTRRKLSESSKNLWKDKNKKSIMASKVSKATCKHDFYQYDKKMNLIKKWDSVKSIIESNPSYKRHNIYSVCSGEKPTMYGYIWRKKLKI